MSNLTAPIREWSDGYIALKRRAEAVRGWIELNPETREAVRWPRVTGTDVIAIAAFIDAHLRSAPSFADSGLSRRWRASLGDIEMHALSRPTETYAEARSFWNSLAAAFVYLSSIEAPLPSHAMWRALLGALAERRNGGPTSQGPFGTFANVKTFDDLYIAHYKHLRDLRGADPLAPEPGMGGGTIPIPRATNADVIALADYWGAQLSTVKRVMGHEGVAKRWSEAIADVAKLARGSDPAAVYPKNNRFWRTLKNTAVHIAAAQDVPTNWDLAVDAIKDSVKQLPDNLAKGAEVAASKIAEVSRAVAEGAGAIVNKAAKGALGGLGTPLLIGGGLVGAFLLLRGRGTTKTSA